MAHWRIETREHAMATDRRERGWPTRVGRFEYFERNGVTVAQVYGTEEIPGLQIVSNTLDLRNPHYLEDDPEYVRLIGDSFMPTVVWRLKDEAIAAAVEGAQDLLAPEGQYRAIAVGDILRREWEDPERRYSAMQKMDGPTMSWNVNNILPDVGATISLQALKSLTGHMQTWLGTRLKRRIDSGKSAKRPIVTLSVEFEDD